MCVIYSWFVSSRFHFRFRMCQLSAPTHRNGGNCLIRIRNASITTMRPHRRPYGIGRASVTLFRWPSCKRSSRIPIPASDGSRQRRKSNLRCQSSRSSSCCSTPPCRQPTKRGVANVQVAAMEQWPHPKRSSAARPTAKWSLVREAVKVFGMNWFKFLFIKNYLFTFLLKQLVQRRHGWLIPFNGPAAAAAGLRLSAFTR